MYSVLNWHLYITGYFNLIRHVAQTVLHLTLIRWSSTIHSFLKAGCLTALLAVFCIWSRLLYARTLQVNMFTNQGTVIHFNNPKVQASLAANTFTITGHAETKQLTEMLPSILNQLGADSLTSLRKLAEALPKQGELLYVVFLYHYCLTWTVHGPLLYSLVAGNEPKLLKMKSWV